MGTIQDEAITQTPAPELFSTTSISIFGSACRHVSDKYIQDDVTFKLIFGWNPSSQKPCPPQSPWSPLAQVCRCDGLCGLDYDYVVQVIFMVQVVFVVLVAQVVLVGYVACEAS